MQSNRSSNKTRIGTNLLFPFLLPILVIAFSTPGCSYLFVADIARISEKQLSWKATTGCGVDIRNEAFEFELQSETVRVSITVCPGYEGGWSLLTGPPLIPIIPNPIAIHHLLFGHNEPYVLLLKITCTNSPTLVDLSSVKLILPNNQALQPKTVYEDGWCIYCWQVPSKAIPIDTILVTNGTRSFRLVYDIRETDLASYCLQIEKVMVAGENLDIPIVEIIKKHDYYYFPFLFGG